MDNVCACLDLQSIFMMGLCRSLGKEKGHVFPTRYHTYMSFNESFEFDKP